MLKKIQPRDILNGILIVVLFGLLVHSNYKVQQLSSYTDELSDRIFGLETREARQMINNDSAFASVDHSHPAPRHFHPEINQVWDELSEHRLYGGHTDY